MSDNEKEDNKDNKDIKDNNEFKNNINGIRNIPEGIESLKTQLKGLDIQKDDNAYNYINEKQFYKTSGIGFNTSQKKFNLGIVSKNKNRIRTGAIEKQKRYGGINFKENEKIIAINKPSNTIIDTLTQKIEEITNVLENNENTFVYNQKIQQKKLNEKEKRIEKLTQELKSLKENNKKELENNIVTLKKNYINTIKQLTKENNILKNQNQELSIKNEDNENKISNLESENKTLIVELDSINQKYESFISNTDKKLIEEDINELVHGYNDKLLDYQNNINILNEELLQLNQENKELKDLTKQIIEARNETEIFFSDALNEVKKDLYKLRKEKDKRGKFFPVPKKNYEDNTVKVDIRTLAPEMREKILRNLFNKINRGYDPEKYKELNNIMAADINDEDF